MNVILSGFSLLEAEWNWASGCCNCSPQHKMWMTHSIYPLVFYRMQRLYMSFGLWSQTGQADLHMAVVSHIYYDSAVSPVISKVVQADRLFFQIYCLYVLLFVWFDFSFVCLHIGNINGISETRELRWRMCPVSVNILSNVYVFPLPLSCMGLKVNSRVIWWSWGFYFECKWNLNGRVSPAWLEWLHFKLALNVFIKLLSPSFIFVLCLTAILKPLNVMLLMRTTRQIV